jgi:UDP-N-acetylglucosamine--N-acetylmuramyl-(pentapeptide) pyrophosphoryl-undecaprenol N-acetylglucosamine transferase
MERIILTTGGTGGHIFPALSVAEEILRRKPGVSILFMGGRSGPEADMAAKAGLDFIGLPVRGVLGRGGRGFLAAFGMLRGLVKAYGIMRRFRPDLVAGFGGYAAFAGVLAGKLAGAVTVVHEQNAYPGMANRLLGKVAERVFLSMPDAAGVFAAKKTLLVGNPVRAAIAELYEQRVKETRRSRHATQERREARASRLLVMGGSLGAHAVNRAMTRAVRMLCEHDVEIWHQTGPEDYESVRAAYRMAGAEHARVEPFIADMRQAYAWADLVLCRAGGSSIAEITAAGLPAIVVPLPWAAQDHQRHNAGFLEKAGGALVLEQSRFSAVSGKGGAVASATEEPARGPGGEDGPLTLARTILSLIHDSAALEIMAGNSLAAAKPYAARDLVDALEALLADTRAKEETCTRE